MATPKQRPRGRPALVKLQMVHGLCNKAGAYISPIPQYIDGSLCSGVGHDLCCSTYAYPQACIGGYSSADEPYELPNGYGFAMEGKLTENCAQLHDVTGVGNEQEVALLVRY